jgi:hypothetical protein
MARSWEHSSAVLFHDTTLQDPIVLNLHCRAEDLAAELLARPALCQRLTVTWRDSSFHLGIAIQSADADVTDPESRIATWRPPPTHMKP